MSGEPTPRQVNNDWQHFEDLLVVPGQRAIMTRGKPDANGFVPGTETSPVTRVIEGLLVVNCSTCNRHVRLLQRGTLHGLPQQTIPNVFGVIHVGKVWCRPCVEDLVSHFAAAFRLACQPPPEVPDPEPPPGLELAA